LAFSIRPRPPALCRSRDVLTDDERLGCNPWGSPQGGYTINPRFGMTDQTCGFVAEKLCPNNTGNPMAGFTVLPGPPPAVSFVPDEFGGLPQDNFGLNVLPTGSGPGAIACGTLGLGPGCTWADIAAAGAGAVVGAFAPEPTPPTTSTGPCPGLFSVQGPDGNCINLTDLAPGGDPAVTPQAGVAVLGLYGAGMRPTESGRIVRKCHPGWVLGNDGVCYDGLPRRKRMWDPGVKPLLTGGERNAIRIAASAGKKLKRAQKQLKKASKALDNC